MAAKWRRTTARLHDGGLNEDDEPEAEEEGCDALVPAAIMPRQLAAARQRVRTLAFWQQAAGSAVNLVLLDGSRARAELTTCDGKQERLYVQGLQTPIGTYRQAAVHTLDLASVELDGEWQLDPTWPAASSPALRFVLEGRDARDGLLLRSDSTSSHASQLDLPPAPPGADALIAGKYWSQRTSLFSKYALGVRLDQEGWFSVTPERLAEHIAERCQCDLVLDAFAGVGGNAIQFAFTCERVLAIDLDLDRLLLARHNARIYGVADRIEFVHGDFTALASRLRADAVFLSPPWGGPGYQAASEFGVRTMMGGLDGFELLRLALAISPHVAYYLPRNTARADLAAMPAMQAEEYAGSFETERCVLNGRLKALTAYFGDLAQAQSGHGS
jgi:trimethylguanosine synthase